MSKTEIINNTNDKNIDKSIDDQTKEINKNAFFWIKKILWLCLSISMLSLAHSIFTYAREIGMSPLTATTEAIAILLGKASDKIDGYSFSNYIITTILIIAAIILADKKERLVTASCAITGYGLAFVINIFIVYVVSHFPGMHYDSITNQGIAKTIWYALLWYLVGYVLLVNAIGMWINVGFGLRPYDAFLVNLETRFEKYSYLFWRNLFSLIFVVLAIICGLITTGIENNWTLKNFIENSAVGPATIITMFLTGKLTKITRRLYSYIV